MPQEYIELKQRRDIGQLITDYFAFFKQNLKSLLNIFISYNGIFILAFLGVSYLLVTGFVGMYQTSFGAYGNETAPSTTDTVYWIVGILGLLLILLVTSLLNYSLSTSAVIEYEQNGTVLIDKKSVWKRSFDKLGSTILFILLAGVIYVGVMIVGLLVSIIPFVGIFAYYFILLAYMCWMGVSYTAMLHKNYDIGKALGEGWNLLMANFWRCVLTNLVVWILLFILLGVVLLVPGVLIGIYAYHSLESGVDLAQSPVSKIVWTLAFALYLIAITLNQFMGQLINGILYYSLYEEKYNEFAQSKINEIGKTSA